MTTEHNELRTSPPGVKDPNRTEKEDPNRAGEDEARKQVEDRPTPRDKVQGQVEAHPLFLHPGTAQVFSRRQPSTRAGGIGHHPRSQASSTQSEQVIEQEDLAAPPSS